jgi:hypothetical protein
MTAKEKIEDLIFRIVEEEELNDKHRHRPKVYRRCYLSYYLRDKLKWNYSKIGRLFNKDHATIMHLYKQHYNLSEGKFKDPYYWDIVKDLPELLVMDNFFDDIVEINIYDDIANCNSYEDFKLIKKRVVEGYYNIKKISTFARDRATDTSEVDQELGEGGVLRTQTIGHE